jgi:predicted RNase H-like HicB family nuclease
MHYPIAIEPLTSNTAFAVVVPDPPGCFSTGDTLGEAFTNAVEAATIWLDAAIDTGAAIPAPSPLSVIQNTADYAVKGGKGGRDMMRVPAFGWHRRTALNLISTQ